MQAPPPVKGPASHRNSGQVAQAGSLLAPQMMMVASLLAPQMMALTLARRRRRPPASATASGQRNKPDRKRMQNWQKQNRIWQKLRASEVREALEELRAEQERMRQQAEEHMRGEAIRAALLDSEWDRVVELIREDRCRAPQLLYRDSGGMTPLHKAARVGKDKIAEMILNKCPEAANIPTYVSEGHN